MNDNMASVTDEDLLESFRCYCLTLDKPKESDKEEIKFALELAKKQIEWLQKLVHGKTVGAGCVIVRIDNAIKLMEKV